MRPDFGIVGIHCNTSLQADGYHRAVVVDTKQAKYKGKEWQSLSQFYKRKFENLIILAEPTERTKVLYI